MTKTNQIISSVILAACFPIMAILPSHPASLLFIFISGNKWVGTARLAVALILLAISFGLVKPGQAARKPMLLTGLSMIGLGIFALIITSFGSFLYDYMKLLDDMILIEAGIVLCGQALTLRITTSAAKPANLSKSRPKTKIATA